MILIADYLLICIVPGMVRSLRVIEQQGKQSMREKLHFGPVGFNLLSYKKIMGETAFFGSFLVSIKRVLLGTGISMVCILMAAYPLSRTKKQSRKEISLCGYSCSACYLTEERFRGISP